MLAKTLILGLLSAVAVNGAAISIGRRANGTFTCGSNSYSQSNVDQAVKKGFSLFQSGDTVGSNDYPHEYHDREGFDFPTEAPYYEFPILSSHKAYDGGSPGADRVVFDSQGALDGLLTHTGADGNNFVQCKQG